MDQIRRAIKDKFGDQHFSLNVIDLSRDEYFQLNHQKQESARTRQLHQQYIKDPDAIVAIAVRTLDSSPEWPQKFLFQSKSHLECSLPGNNKCNSN